MVSGQVYVHHLLAAIDFLLRQRGAALISAQQGFRQMVDERPFKGAGQDRRFVVYENVDAGPLQGIDDRGAIINHTVVGISHHRIGAPEAFARFGSKEIEQQGLGLLVREQAQLMGIFEIHNLIANIVGRFYEIHERMARKA